MFHPDSLIPIRHDGDAIQILDQTELPFKIVWKNIRTDAEMSDAIASMAIRGAPAIGIAGAFAVALAVKDIADTDDFESCLQLRAAAIQQARPTAVNLMWACRRVVDAVLAAPARMRASRAMAAARDILDDDLRRSQSLSRHGAALIHDGDELITHCNAGGLATSGYGTALGVIRAASEGGKKCHVWVSETRPRLQGARLTAFELKCLGIPHTLMTDNMAADLMRRRRIAAVIVGADRIAANGDTANKIGTYALAIAASAHKVPFYVAAPASTIDTACASGEVIPIENRAPEEVTHVNGRPIAYEGVHALNPAFDVTPASYISAIITEDGVFYPPFRFHPSHT